MYMWSVWEYRNPAVFYLLCTKKNNIRISWWTCSKNNYQITYDWFNKISWSHMLIWVSNLLEYVESMYTLNILQINRHEIKESKQLKIHPATGYWTLNMYLPIYIHIQVAMETDLLTMLKCNTSSELVLCSKCY